MHSMVPPDFMRRQTDINEKLRANLLNWLVVKHHKFKVQTRPLWLTANLVDRFLAVSTINGDDLHLVGVTGLMLAAKYEEVAIPKVSPEAEVLSLLLKVNDSKHFIPFHCCPQCLNAFFATRTPFGRHSFVIVVLYIYVIRATPLLTRCSPNVVQ